ncbi:MAG TPA: YbfB/YjiJ family MFS transporter, partial [Geminicoccaceae bacterium]|nr:YbfB/YjiJ family MFS transporter [Geminicoccaceae bacterium]
LLLVAYACDAIGFVPHTVFWVDYVARGLGHGLAAGGASWIVFGMAALGGSFAAGLIADRLGFGPSLVLALCLKAAAVGLPLAWSGPLALALSAATVGALTPATVTLASGRAAELVGPEHHRQVWGWLTSAFAVAQAAAAYGMSFLFAETDAYGPLFAIACGALALGTLCALAGSRGTAGAAAGLRGARAR